MTFAQLPTFVIVCIAFAGLVVTIGASEILVRGVGRLARIVGLLGGLVGLIIALCTDSPEIASAVISTAKGSASTGVGVVIGSNIFNLAVLLASATFAAGEVRIHRSGLFVDAGVAMVVTIVLGAAILGRVPLGVAWILLLIVFPPYVVFLSLQPSTIKRLRLPPMAGQFLVAASSESALEGEELAEEIEANSAELAATKSLWPVFLAAPALIAIVLGALVLVESALTLGQRWGVSDTIVGLVGLAAATSLPNAYAAARLARDGRGTAVVSATFNSNTLNLIAGFAVPALFLSVSGTLVPSAYLLWLLAMTVLALILLARGLRRPGAIGLLALYALFVVYAVATA